MKKKKIVIGTLIATAVLGVSSCSKDDTPTTVTTPPVSVEQQWTVSFDVKGGSAITNVSVKNGAKISKPSDPQKTGYTFVGWYKESAYNHEWNFDVDVVTANTTLYAKWEEVTPEPTPEEKYSVTYEINGHGEQPENLTDVKNLQDPLPTLSEEGWTFGGWYLDAELTQQAEAGAEITANTTLYAKWEEVTPEPTPEEKYSVTYEINGHGEQPENLTDVKNLQNPLPTLSEEGWTFGGWYLDAELTQQAEAGAEITANTTLYAKWTANETPEPTPEEKYSVTYEINGHGEQPENLTDVKNLQNPLPTLSEEGWTFGGWYLDSELTQQAEAGATITANTTLYAKWTANETPEPTPEEKYSVTYEINGHGEQPENLTDVKNLQDPLPTLSEEGWTFGGWYLDAELTQKAEAGAEITANTTLYAKWTASEYTITFNNNGYGDECEEISSSFLPNELPVLSAEDMIFEGWYYESTFENKVELGVKLVSNITLYAKWTKTPYKDFIDQDNVLYASNFKDETEEIIDSYNYEGSIPNNKWYGKILDSNKNAKAFDENNYVTIKDGKLCVIDKSNATTIALMNLEEKFSSVLEIKSRIDVSGKVGSKWPLFSLLDIEGKSFLDIRTGDKIGSNVPLGYQVNGIQTNSSINIVDGSVIDLSLKLDLATKKVNIILECNGNKQEFIDVEIPYTSENPLVLSGVQFYTAAVDSRNISVDWLGVRVVEEKLVEWKEFLCNYATNYYNGIELGKYTKNAEQLEKTYNATLAAIKAANSIDSALEVFNNGMEELSSIKSDEQIEAEEYKPTKIQEINELKEAKKNLYVTVQSKISIKNKSQWKSPTQKT